MPETLLNGHLAPEDGERFQEIAARYNNAAKRLNESLHHFNKTVWAHAEQCGVDSAKSAYDDVAGELAAFCRDHRVLTIGGSPYRPEPCELSDAYMKWENECDHDSDVEGALEETVCLDGDSLAQFRGEEAAA